MKFKDLPDSEQKELYKSLMQTRAVIHKITDLELLRDLEEIFDTLLNEVKIRVRKVIDYDL